MEGQVKWIQYCIDCILDILASHTCSSHTTAETVRVARYFQHSPHFWFIRQKLLNSLFCSLRVRMCEFFKWAFKSYQVKKYDCGESSFENTPCLFNTQWQLPQIIHLFLHRPGDSTCFQIWNSQLRPINNNFMCNAAAGHGRGRGFGSSKFSFRTRGTFKPEKERERERERERGGKEEKVHICWHQNCGTLNSSFFSVIVVFYYHESESNIWACCFTKHFPQIFLFCLSIHGRLAHESIRHESESIVCGLALSAWRSCVCSISI